MLSSLTTAKFTIARIKTRKLFLFFLQRNELVDHVNIKLRGWFMRNVLSFASQDIKPNCIDHRFNLNSK